MGEFFATLGEDYNQTGWITDKGVFVPCADYDHDKIAEEITGEAVKEVEKRWIRIGLIFGKNHLQFQGKKINKKQHKALEEWGLNTLLEKQRVYASDEFQAAYFK